MHESAQVWGPTIVVLEQHSSGMYSGKPTQLDLCTTCNLALTKFVKGDTRDAG